MECSNRTDSRFTINGNFFGEADAESSQYAKSPSSVRDQSSDHDQEMNEQEVPEGDYERDASGEENHDLAEGMDPEGFLGPSKVVKPLTPEALAAFKAAQERAGVIYISRIPPGMRPTRVRHLMSAYGEVGRVYLQQEGARPLFFSFRSQHSSFIFLFFCVSHVLNFNFVKMLSVLI